MSSVFFDSEITDEERRARLYAGDIFILSPTDGTRALINLARKMLEEAFSPYDPRTSMSARHRKRSSDTRQTEAPIYPSPRLQAPDTADHARTWC